MCKAQSELDGTRLVKPNGVLSVAMLTKSIRAGHTPLEKARTDRAPQAARKSSGAIMVSDHEASLNTCAEGLKALA